MATAMLVAAGALAIVGPPSWAGIVLAGASTVILALDKRFGWLPAGMVALLALPYGRSADVLALYISDWPVRPPDIIVAIAIGGAVLGGRSRLARPHLEPALMAAFGALLAVGLIALVIGVLEGHALRDVVRDVRFWSLYLVGGLALLTGVRRAPLIRALALGGGVFCAVVIAVALLPSFDGGLKSQSLYYDRGTLRLFYGNSMFLLPTIALSVTIFLRRRSTIVGLLLVVMITVITLSLTRTQLAVAIGVVALVVAWTVVRQWRATSRPPAIWRPAAVLGLAGLAVIVGIGINGFQPAVPEGTAAGEDPVARLLGRSEASDIEAIVDSPTGRFASYREAYNAILEAPMLGHGLGKLIPNPFAYSEDRAYVIGMQPAVDNTFLTIGVKAGALGVTAIGALLLVPLVLAFRRRSRLFLRWFAPAWLGVLALAMTESFASSGYTPYALGLVATLPTLGWRAAARTSRGRVSRRIGRTRAGAPDGVGSR